VMKRSHVINRPITEVKRQAPLRTEPLVKFQEDRLYHVCRSAGH